MTNHKQDETSHLESLLLLLAVALLFAGLVVLTTDYSIPRELEIRNQQTQTAKGLNP